MSLSNSFFKPQNFVQQGMDFYITTTNSVLLQVTTTIPI